MARTVRTANPVLTVLTVKMEKMVKMALTELPLCSKSATTTIGTFPTTRA